MKKMFYVLLALLVSMVLVFGVSCDNSNKAPGGAEGNSPVEEPGTGEEPGGEDPTPEYPIDLGTDSVKVPEWADGTYEVSMNDSPAGELKIESGIFTMNVSAGPVTMTVSSNNIDLITKQIDTESNGMHVYELNADVLDLGSMGKGPASFVFTQVDDNILTLTGFVTLGGSIKFDLDITCEK